MRINKALAIFISLALTACSLLACSSADSGGTDTTAEGGSSTAGPDGTAASGDITTYLDPVDPRLAELDYEGK